MIQPPDTRTLNRVFVSDFATDPGALARDWNTEDLHDGWHQVGNLDERDKPLPGRRWAATYDAHQDRTLLLNPGKGLGLAAVIERGPDEHRENYTDPRTGRVSAARDARIYLPWIQSARPIWSNEQSRHVVAEFLPDATWRYGYFEIEFDASEFACPGCRFSVWLMPAADGRASYWGKAYDDDAGNGVETDIAEIEMGGRFGNTILAKNIAGDAGQTPHGAIDARTVGVDLADGQPHVLGHLWTAEGHVWFIDGREIQRDTTLVSHVPSMLVISREANTGVIEPRIDGTPAEPRVVVGPKRPRDPGLYGDDVFQHLDALVRSVMWVRRIEVWQPHAGDDYPALFGIDDTDDPASIPLEPTPEPTPEPQPEPATLAPEPPVTAPEPAEPKRDPAPPEPAEFTPDPPDPQPLENDAAPWVPENRVPSLLALYVIFSVLLVLYLVIARWW